MWLNNQKSKLNIFKSKEIYVKEKKCDIFSKLNRLDMQELMKEIDNFNLEMREVINIKKRFTFGTEIEFRDCKTTIVSSRIQRSFGPLISKYTGWTVKYDDTVSTRLNDIDYGGEINSPILHDNEITWKQLSIICSILKEEGAKTDSCAAGHIHVGSQILGSNIDSWVNFLKMWALYEKIIYRFSFGEKKYGRTDIQKYAMPISEELYQFIKVIEKLKPRDYNFTQMLSIIVQKRNRAVNFKNVSKTSFAKGNTIEIRCPNSTVESVIWQNNINFFTKFLLYAASDEYDKDLISKRLKKNYRNNIPYELYNEVFLQEALELADLIFDNNLDKLYFLRQYLKDYQKPNEKEKNLIKTI